jgi:enamine deaminase RidA (YjgF/YER057c/UK114 family)
MNEHLKPSTLMASDAYGYTQVVVSTGTRTIHIAGQVAVDAHGNVAPEGDLAGQMKKALDNVRLALVAAGADKKDLVQMRYYVVNYDENSFAAMMPVIKDFFGDIPPPANTLLGVSALAWPELLIEIDGTAVL